MSPSPSAPQLEKISTIERAGGNKFTGATFSEAYKYIGDNKNFLSFSKKPILQSDTDAPYYSDMIYDD